MCRVGRRKTVLTFLTQSFVATDASTAYSLALNSAVALQITVEAPVEHPFLVYNKGWCSVNPAMSMQRYKLVCNTLVIGDLCASLTLKPSSPSSASGKMLHKFSEESHGLSA